MHATEIATRLAAQGIRPSAQRVAIAGYVLTTDEHPSADSVWRRVRELFPMVSRATVYNTLNLFAERGLLRELTLAPGCSVFDANTAPHHHFVDDADGSIHDVPWESVAVSHIDRLDDYDVREFSVVMRGRRRGEHPEPG